MRKFAMTLLLGLGMASASFAGTSTNAEEASPKAPKACTTVYTSCGVDVTICGISDDETWDQADIMEAIYCG